MQPLFYGRKQRKALHRLVSNRGGLGTSLYLLGFGYYYTTHIVRKSTLNQNHPFGYLLGQQQTTPDLPLVGGKKWYKFWIECMCAWGSLRKSYNGCWCNSSCKDLTCLMPAKGECFFKIPVHCRFLAYWMSPEKSQKKELNICRTKRINDALHGASWAVRGFKMFWSRWRTLEK